MTATTMNPVKWTAHHLGAAAMLATIGTLPASAQTTMEDAVAAFRLHLYAEAYEVFEMHVEQDNAVAQFNLGVMYANGQGISEDDAKAARWYRRAAEQGHADGRACQKLRV